VSLALFLMRASLPASVIMEISWEENSETSGEGVMELMAGSRSKEVCRLLCV